VIESAESEQGRVVAGKYRLVRLLGRGGMGTVFVAEHVQVRRSFALKFVRPDRMTTPRYLRRFEREAELLGRLDHENIVSLHDIGVDATSGPYLVLEYVRGVTLREEFERLGVRPLERILAVVEQVARGLSHAHGLGVIHRDLKPENVMLASHADGSLMVKLLDFGVAGLRGDDGERMTLSDTAIGTASYMAPEQARGDRALDARTDVYALGVITYEALSGALPYTGDSYNETLFKILHRKHPNLGVLRPELPERLVAAIERSLSKDIDGRHSSAAEFARHLLEDAGVQRVSANLVDSTRSTAEGSAVHPALTRKRNVGLGAAAALAFGAGAGYLAGTLESHARSASPTMEAVPTSPAASAALGAPGVLAPASVSSNPPPRSSAAEPARSEAASPVPSRIALPNAQSRAAPWLVPPVSSASFPPSSRPLPDLGKRGYIVDNPYTGLVASEEPRR
jgi:serine/threonine-protein kinase